MESYSTSYKESGVDITSGYKAVELMSGHVARTRSGHPVDTIGGFGGCYALPDGNILVSGTDGVGTKLKLAFLLDKHDTVGIDLVAMCVNDVVCLGARPLYFLDYIATGKNIPEKIAQIVKGVADGCVEAGCALVGGETAEMPGFYPGSDYDLAGFSTGIVHKDKLVRKERVSAGDIALALPSSGVHSNGFSLVRKVFDLEAHPENIHRRYPELDKPLGETLLTPTRIYVKPVLSLLEKVDVKAVAHITGGGFYENIPRALPGGLSLSIRKSDVRILPVFPVIQREGSISEHDMFNTFNMGVGMVIIVPEKDVNTALSVVPDAYVLGIVTEGGEGVRIW